MADITKVELGPCDVSFNGVDLGHTKEGVEVNYAPVYHDITVDKYGETVVEKILVGEKLTARVRLAEYTIANLRNAIPQSQFAGAANTRITIGAAAGKEALTDAAELVLHPTSKGTREHDVVFWKAYVANDVVIPHQNAAEKTVEVIFEALLDESRSDGNYLGMIGDSTT